MKIHLELSGDVTIRHEAHGQPAGEASEPFVPRELEASGLMAPPAPAGELFGPTGAIAELKKRQHQQAATALVRAIPDDPDWAKHVPLEYRLNAKVIVDFLLEDLHARRTGEGLQQAHFAVELADWGMAAAEMFEVVGVAGIASLFSPLLAAAGALFSLGAGYAEANLDIATERARVGFSYGAVTSTHGLSVQKIVEHWGQTTSHYGAGAADDANTIAQTYHLAGLAAGYLQGRRLSANQRTVFWKDLRRRVTSTKPGWEGWMGAFYNNHLEHD